MPLPCRRFVPKPKPRPGLILTVFDDDDPKFSVEIAYGTSKRVTTSHRGEFAISKTLHPAAYPAAG